MFAVIETGGKQYIVKEGQRIEVEKIDVDEGKTVEIKEVLFIGEDGKVVVGQPKVKNAKVKARVLTHKRGEKIVAFKKKAKTGYKKKIGHRQYLTVLKIEKIVA